MRFFDGNRNNLIKKILKPHYLFTISLFGMPLSSCLFNSKQNIHNQNNLLKFNQRFNQPVRFNNAAKPQELSSNYNQPPEPENFNTNDSRVTLKSASGWWNPYVLNLNYAKELSSTKTKLANLSIQNMREDIISSLYEITDNNPDISIDFDNLNLSFDASNDEQSVRNVQSFLLSFNIANLSLQSFKIFNSVSIYPQSSAHIVVNMQYGQIVFDAVAGSTNMGSAGGYYESWNIQPTLSSKIVVSINYLLGKYSGASHEFEPINFKLLNSRSYFWNKILIGYSDNLKSAEIIKHANRIISQESNENLKKDINDWLLTYLRYQFLLGWLDVQSIIKYLMRPTYIDEFSGKKITLLEALASDNADRRNDILNKFGLDSTPFIRDLIGALLSKKRDGSPSNYKEIGAFLNYILSLDLQKIFNEWLVLKAIWYQEPNLNSNDPYNPTVSFSLGLDVIFNHDVNIKMKNSDGWFMGQKIPYDGSQYLSVNNILEVLLGKKSKEKFWANLLKGIGHYLHIDNVVVKKSEYISLKFDAHNSPITFTNPNMFDYTKGLLETFGLKITNVDISINLSGMKRFFATVYHSLNMVKWINFGSTLADLFSFGALVKGMINSKQLDLGIFLKIMDYFFVDDNERKKISFPRGSRKDRPLEFLFDYIINQNYEFHSLQLNINITRAFNYLPNSYNKIPLWKEFYNYKTGGWNQSNKSQYEAHQCFDDQTISSLSSCFKNDNYKVVENNVTKDVDFQSGYYNNPDFNLSVMKPYNRDNDFYYDPRKNDANAKFLDMSGFNLIWKDQRLQDLFYNRKMQVYDETSVVFNSKKFYETLDKKIKSEQFKTNDKMYKFKEEVDNLLRSNITNPNGDIKIAPEVSLVRLPLEWTLRSLLDNRQRAGILSHIDTSNLFNENVFVRDPYLMLINSKTGFNFFSKQEYVNFDKTSSLKFYFIPPIIDHSKIKCPRYVQKITIFGIDIVNINKELC